MQISGRISGFPSLAALVLGVLSLPGVAEATLVGPGDIAFIRYNADGFDDFAIVLLADADAGQQVSFNDNEYSSTFMQFGQAEDHFVWQIDQALAAGTVVTFTDLDRGSTLPSVSHGSILNPTTNIMQLNAAGDGIFAYLGTDPKFPDAFLGAFLAESATALNGTGLVAGDTAVVVTPGSDEAQYVGDRQTQMSFPDYRPLIGDVAGNWQVRTADTGTLPPFNSADFQVNAATPESPPMVILGLSLFLATLWIFSRRQQPVIDPGTA